MVYYLEVNCTAIIVGVLLLAQSRKMTSQKETSQIIMHWMLGVLIVFSASDVAAYWFRGKSAFGVEIANMCYFILMALGSYLWLLYICVKMRNLRKLSRLLILTGIPAALLCLAILLNPWTNFFFSVDDQNLYHRGNGVFLTWIVEWGYILAALVVNIRAIMTEKKTYRKQELKGYLIFLTPMAAAALVQMFFYGTTTNQIGFMIAMLMAFSNRQSHLVQRDELTGLNNRNAFLNYRDYMVTRTREIDLTLFMLDADNFKAINDAYGHLSGDQALRDIADILRTAAAIITHRRVILYRYAGDEFIIAGTELNEEDNRALVEEIHRQVDLKNEANAAQGIEYRIGLSVGFATKPCITVEEFDGLLEQADEAMYNIKKNKNLKRGL